MSAQRAEASLIVLSAGTAARRALTGERARSLAPTVDWDLLTGMLSARRLLPQLGPRIVDDCAEHAPERFSAAVEQAVAQTRHQAALLQLLCLRITGALEEAGIPSLVLKGPFLGEAIYGDAGRRPAGDVDLFVPAQDLEAAVQVVRRAGYRAPTDHVTSDGLPLLHCALAHERGQLPPLELHWRVHWYEREFASQMLARAVEDPRGARRPSAPDELACLLLCYARDGFVDLRLATDIGAWWDTFSPSLMPGALEEISDRHPALARPLLAAATVADRVVGVPAEALLRSPRRLDARAALATRLANPTARGPRWQLSADMGLVDWLLAPRGGQWQFVRRQLLPPREVLEQRSRARGERCVSPLGHGARVLVRYGLALMRLGSLPLQAHNRPFSAPRSTSSRPP